MQIDKLTIIGVGMIGGSLALALKQQSLTATICGYDLDDSNLETALRLGVIDEKSADLHQAVAAADVVVLAVPLAAYQPILAQLSSVVERHTVITDVGSAKGSVVMAARSSLAKHIENFVPAHPIAGRERSGVQASDANLFYAHTIIITPLAETSAHAKAVITQMWELAGAQVTELTVQHHDDVLAATSHLPHVLAYALVDCLAGMQDKREIFAYAAGGFADFSRIASSNPQMWHDVCLANREPLLKALDAYQLHLQDIRQAIVNEDSQRLLNIFTHSKLARDNYTAERSKPGS